MQHICVVLLLAIASGITSQTTGDEWTHVIGILNKDVLLPCVCLNITDLKFKWQKDNANRSFVLINETRADKKYESRTKTFLKENESNCSLLLKNITTDDSGNYSCRFRASVYKNHLVNLTVIPESSSEIPIVGFIIGPTDSPKTSRQFFTVIPVVVFLLAVGYLWNKYFRRRMNWNAPNQEV
ncbi:uncharacterized protein si:dkey-192g7.3 isoform X2 [Girardinichthys multiradiatus]|uniref:uncharacterized protein si:dkey-192g7.3 isoform X2 n=1 Tax=Girardinichthys multiradiatus TaxID=208333 RepID=UPI001FABDC8B|nr:uncharacterized protein si:dkey-192g7.3 isoform X2 [Girardinichthys multiradiatus]